jgi:type II secretory pathway component PulF
MASLSFDEIDRLTQELASLTRAGIPLPEGLAQLASSLGNGRLQSVATELSREIERGTPLSEALRKSPHSFPREFIAVVECGEISGDARAIFDFALQHGRRVKRHRSELVTAVFYPLLLILICIGIVLLLSNTAVPVMKDIFAQLGAELPFLTQAIVSTCGFIEGPKGFIVAGLVAGLLIAYGSVPQVRDRVVNMLTLLPGMRYLFGLSDTAIYMKFLGVMLERKVPLPIALRASSLAVSQAGTRQALIDMSEAAERGQPVGAYLGTGVPSTAAYLFRQAEERGSLAETCSAIADYCEKRFERLSFRALVMFEPMAIMFIAIIVAVIIISLYLPLFSIPKLIR